MPTAEAQIETERPSRYLVQLCRHAAAMTGPRGHRRRTHGEGDGDGDGDALALREARVRAEWSETRGVVDFAPWGQCTLAASADLLVLHVEAADEESLRRIQDVITRDLDRFGRRDHLTVNWHRPEAPHP